MGIQTGKDVQLSDFDISVDVLIVGGGNAALCAAMTARETGATVLILECSPIEFRGGNSRHTRNIRYLHHSGNDFLTGPYLEDEFLEDLMRITGGNTTKSLAELTIKNSMAVGDWMQAHGCKFQPAMRGTLHLARTNAFFLGGGKALMNAYYHHAESSRIYIAYNAELFDIDIVNNKFRFAYVKQDNEHHKISAKSIVIASGGFQANRDWLRQYWGKSADNFIIRGTPFDKGIPLRLLLDNGANSIGDPQQCHAVAIDARAPREDGGIVTRLDCVSFGVVVNNEAKRFYDEGEDYWPKRYAIWGRLVAQQKDQIAYSIIDSKSINLFIPSVFPPIEANTVEELAESIGLRSSVLVQTIKKYNESIHIGNFDPTQLDDCYTTNIKPPKSHWARPIDTPPYYGYPLRPGITFSYMGLEVNSDARVVMSKGEAENIFAAGEVMSGNILGQGYMAGFGMTIGTVFGRIAGREAARNAM